VLHAKAPGWSALAASADSSWYDPDLTREERLAGIDMSIQQFQRGFILRVRPQFLDMIAGSRTGRGRDVKRRSHGGESASTTAPLINRRFSKLSNCAALYLRTKPSESLQLRKPPQSLKPDQFHSAAKESLIDGLGSLCQRRKSKSNQGRSIYGRKDTRNSINRAASGIQDYFRES